MGEQGDWPLVLVGVAGVVDGVLDLIRILKSLEQFCGGIRLA